MGSDAKSSGGVRAGGEVGTCSGVVGDDPLMMLTHCCSTAYLTFLRYEILDLTSRAAFTSRALSDVSSDAPQREEALLGNFIFDGSEVIFCDY
jgi:hypothetical protein